MTDAEIDRSLADMAVKVRNSTLDAAIETARLFLDGDHSPACVVRALEDLKVSLNQVRPAPSQQN